MRRSIVLALLVTACGEPLAFTPAGPDAAPDPAVDGPFVVGVRTLNLTDHSRTSSVTGDPITLVAEVWYPATERVRGRQGWAYNVLDFLPPQVVATQQGTDLGAIRTSAVRDARPRADHGPYPMVLFSHGNGSIRVQSTFLTVTLASHGYVVIAVDHAGNTLSDFVSRGEFDLTQTLESFLSRTVDLSRALDLVSSLKEPDPLAGLLDLENVGAMGHSFGASTALRMAGLDDRIKAVAPQAPPGYGFTWIEIETPLEELEVPVLLQVGDADRLTPISLSDSVWNHVRAPGWYVRMRRAGHFTYSDLCELSATAISQATAIGLGDVFEDGCGEDNIETEIAFPLIRNFTVGFFNEFLRRSPSSRDYLDAETATQLAEEDELWVRTATGT